MDRNPLLAHPPNLVRAGCKKLWVLLATVGPTALSDRLRGGCPAGSYLTVRVPCMLEWYLQWKVYVPGFEGAANVAFPPFSLTSTLKEDPSSAVTVCSAVSMFVT